MGDFIYVPIIALFCYIFLFMTLAAARKDRIINSFLLNLVALIFWTGGSFLMRLQVWPSVKFWFDISILGLLLLGFALFNFAFQFVGVQKQAHTNSFGSSSRSSSMSSTSQPASFSKVRSW